jgi:EAL domain-containing protein (putative c-di-GMP-specific phosphodiesterase class I)
VIAEGIEQPGQLDQLRALGCEFGQGYLFARPGDGPSFAAAFLPAATPTRHTPARLGAAGRIRPRAATRTGAAPMPGPAGPAAPSTIAS